jgi:hypothetical protein
MWPSIKWVLGTLILEVKQPGHEDDYSLPSSPKIKYVKGYEIYRKANYSNNSKGMDTCVFLKHPIHTFFLLIQVVIIMYLGDLTSTEFENYGIFTQRPDEGI